MGGDQLDRGELGIGTAETLRTWVRHLTVEPAGARETYSVAAACT
jgi:hypothetical protein